MKKMVLNTQEQAHCCHHADADNASNQVIVAPTKCIGIAERFEKKEKSWFASSQIPTDLAIQVEDITFYVHKNPLMSRSEYISQIYLESANSNSGYNIKLDNFPGGPDTFEIVLKFCYGLNVILTPTNVAQLRCASEFLQMTEEYEEGNLISKTEAFLTFMVLSSWRDSITVLKACESLSPWGENLQIVRRCSDSIASKVILENSTNNEGANGEQWWFNDLSTLRIDHFVRIITAIRAKGSKPEIIGASITHYAEKWLPGMDVEQDGQTGYKCGKNELQLSILSGKREEEGVGHNQEQRMMIEVLVSILPPQKDAVSCKFLLRMLKMALVFSATPALVSELEKRIGMVLEDASVNDLLIPSFKNGNEGKFGSLSSEEGTMHDVDAVQRIVDYFLMYQQQQHQQHQKGGKSNVGKLLDSYLAEIAVDPNLSITKFQLLAESLPENIRSYHDGLYRAIDTYLKVIPLLQLDVDPNLSITKFQLLAESLPENIRSYHDGLYRAIDTYLKTHPALTEHDRRKLCKAMDCEKLSLDACMHASQNDRLPLRTVIQVLLSEQVKFRAALKEKEPVSSEIVSEQESSWSSTKKEIKTIKNELDKVRTKIAELQHDYSVLQQDFEKLKQLKGVSSWSSGWKKIRKSSLFHGKMNNTDLQETSATKSPSSCKDRHRRRQSVS